MEYYNYLTVPSGKELNLHELKNEDYLKLLKFLNGENFEGFYKCLDELLSYSIPDFDALDICDKAYVYIAFYFYSVKGEISIKAEKFDAVDVPLTIILDTLENAYIKDTKKLKILGSKTCEVGYPTRLDIKIDTINVDYASAIKSIENITLTPEQKEKFSKNAPLKVLNEIELFISKNFKTEAYFAKDVIGIKNIKENVVGPAIFYSICYIYRESLEHFYNMLYLVCHYIRVQWEDLLKMTPVEMTILYHNFIEDKENQKERTSKKKSGIPMHDPNVSDALMGY